MNKIRNISLICKFLFDKIGKISHNTTIFSGPAKLGEKEKIPMSQTPNQQTLDLIAKCCALGAVICFVCMPLVSCGDTTISGHEILFSTNNDSQETQYKILSWLVVLAAGFAVLLPKVMIAVASGASAVFLGILLSLIKGSADEMAREMMKFEYGVACTFIGLVLAIFLPLYSVISTPATRPPQTQATPPSTS